MFSTSSLSTACDCEPIGVVAGMMGCEPTTGQCACKSDDIEGRRCDLCKDGKYGLLLNGTCLGKEEVVSG